LRPHVHRGPGHFHHPADVVQALDHDIAPFLVGIFYFENAILGPFQRHDRRHLDRREAAVVVVALDAREGVHQVPVADHEADAPAGHVVALRQGEELDRDVAGTWHLHDGWSFIGIKDYVRVRQVVHDEDVVLARERDHALEERQVHAVRRRVRREADHQHLRLGDQLADRALQLGDEVHARRHAHRADVGAGDDRAVAVERVRRIWYYHGV